MTLSSPWSWKTATQWCLNRKPPTTHTQRHTHTHARTHTHTLGPEPIMISSIFLHVPSVVSSGLSKVETWDSDLVAFASLLGLGKPQCLLREQRPSARNRRSPRRAKSYSQASLALLQFRTFARPTADEGVDCRYSTSAALGHSGTRKGMWALCRGAHGGQQTTEHLSDCNDR